MTATRSALVVGVVLAAATALLGVVAALRSPVPLPVVAHLGGTVARIGTVQVTLAVLVPPALVVVVALVRAAGRLERTAVTWAIGAAAPIVLFLVARLNGVTEAVALVLVYASSAGGVLLRAVHRPGGSPAAFRWSAVLGIVPWGVVAFTQVGAGLVGHPPTPAVRVLTLGVLAAAVLEWVLAYRRRDSPGRPASGLALAALPALLLAVLVLTGV